MDVKRRALAELIGSALLAAAVVGSGIAAQRLSRDEGLQLLENAVVTGAALVALITALGPISAAFNPVITLVERALGAISTRTAVFLVAAQVVGCCLGVVLANLMFELDAVSISTHHRASTGPLLAEVVATLGLVLVVFGTLRNGNRTHLPYAVGAYITSAYWFTSSTSFANPAITAARALTGTFAGIAPSSAPAFIGMQLLGGLLALGVVHALYPAERLAHGLVEP